MVAAGLEESSGMKALAGIISGQNSAIGEDHENHEKQRAQERSGQRAAEGSFGIHRERAESPEVEAVQELIGGQAVVQNCSDAFVGSAGGEVGENEIDGVNQPEDPLAPP